MSHSSLLSHAHSSARSTLKRPPPHNIPVVTSPRTSPFPSTSPAVHPATRNNLAWARDEPPSPTHATTPTAATTATRPSDASSSHTLPSHHDSRWWSFTRSYLSDRRALRDFLPTSASLQTPVFYRRTDKDKGKEREKDLEAPRPRPSVDRLSIPLPNPALPFTKYQTNSPGWDTPWTSRQNAQGPLRRRDTEGSYFAQDDTPDDQQLRRKTIRRFILTNPYVPILFRVINIAFTTAALGIAIRIRNMETANHAMGAVGSSPTVVIIFAPLTLLHVMAAIYLEYFGRPVGLWRTSGKLAHTLSEVLFICAWSAALSLSFDNFFTSLIPCASSSTISWYNEMDRPPSNLPNFEGSIGDRICDEQLILICLVGIGLIAYCSNLVISLFRIFEKIKYQPPQQRH